MTTSVMRGLACAVAACAALTAWPGAVESVVIDEYGNGQWVDSDGTLQRFTGTVLADPSGGALSALVYDTPFTFSVQGDYEIYTPDTHELAGLVRFYGNNTMIFYDNDVGAGQSLADLSGIPTERLSFVLGLSQTLAGNPARTDVNPSAGMAGYEGVDRLYTFLSVIPVPEPGALALAASGASLLLLLRRRKRAGAPAGEEA